MAVGMVEMLVVSKELILAAKKVVYWVDWMVDWKAVRTVD